MVWMVWVFRFPVVSTATVALRGARWNRHRHRRRFSSGPRRAPVAPRTRLGGPVVVRGQPRRRRAPAPRVRCSRKATQRAAFLLQSPPAVCLVGMVRTHLISVVSMAIHARGSAREIARKTLTSVCVSVRLAVVACREVPGYLDSKLFPASAWASCFYKPKPPKTNSGKTSEQMVTLCPFRSTRMISPFSISSTKNARSGWRTPASPSWCATKGISIA